MSDSKQPETQDELDALPEDNGPLFIDDDCIALVVDRHGRKWMTGWVGDELRKKRV